MSTNLTPKNAKKTSIEALGKLIYKTVRPDEGSDDEFFKLVTKAKQDIRDAENYFDNVTNPELVDHAIYKIEAAKSHYTYLIKQAKAKGIRFMI
jgi:hypothetical protein